jgi:hypothetical protein
LDQVSLATLSPLELGRVGLSYNYIPADGWASGRYGFVLELYLDGALYAATSEETLDVGDVGSSRPVEPGTINWGLIGVAAGAVLLVGAGSYGVRTRARKRTGLGQ